MRTRRPAHSVALAAAALVASTALAGCSKDDAGDALGDAASSLGGADACDVAEQIVGSAVRQGKQAVADLDRKPGSAQVRLEGLRDSLTLTSESLSGDVDAAVQDAIDALDDLAASAEAATTGTVDQDEVDAASGRLTDSYAEVTKAC